MRWRLASAQHAVLYLSTDLYQWRISATHSQINDAIFGIKCNKLRYEGKNGGALQPPSLRAHAGIFQPADISHCFT
jgi:hypothetical protein